MASVIGNPLGGAKLLAQAGGGVLAVRLAKLFDEIERDGLHAGQVGAALDLEDLAVALDAGRSAPWPRA